MNLLDIRKKFVQLSGRYDMVVDTTDWANDGADFYIQVGQKLIEKMVEVPLNVASMYVPLEAGDYKVSWEYHTRAIHEVWVETSEGRYRAEKFDLDEIKEVYKSKMSETDETHDFGYSIADLRALSIVDMDDFGEYLENVEPVGIDVNQAKGIILVPPVTCAATVQIKGVFHQFVLTEDDDENFWTLEAPDLLLRAALYELETFSRGTENAKNWLSAIQTDALLLDKDLVEEYSYKITQMKG